jgi:hypothetical protein
MKTKLLILFVLAFQFGFSQGRTCGMEEKMAEMMFNPLLKQKYEQRQIKFEEELQKLQSSRQSNVTNSEPFRIPVAVHYPNAGGANATVRNCLRNLAQNQIDILNADYNANNADLINWTEEGGASEFFPGINYGSLNIQLELATQNHPEGMGLTEGQVAVTFGYDFGSGSDWDPFWAGYLNIVVRNDLGGTLGYAYLASDPADGATIVMNNSAFGSTGNGCTGYMPGAPYNLGRTLTHELGHYFNLNHTFVGCTNTNCATQGDRVCDTPPSNAPEYGCPSPGSIVKCGVTTLTMNYMDYTNDACMYMFTEGQALRQQAHFNTISSNFNQTTLSSSTFIKKNEITIYPNPNKGFFTLNFDNLIEDATIEVIDVSGRIVLKTKVEDSTSLEQNIDLTSAAKGVYIVLVKSNTSSMTKKVIID